MAGSGASRQTAQPSAPTIQPAASDVRQMAREQLPRDEKSAQLEADRQAQEAAKRRQVALNALPALRTALGSVPCSLLAAEARSDGVLAVTGVAADESSVRSRIESASSGVPSALSLNSIAPPLCAPLTATSPLRDHNQTLAAPVSVLSSNPEARYLDGQNLIVNVFAPGFSAYLQVDYFTLEGDVAHLFPNGLQPGTRLAPGEQRRLGDRAAGGQAWRVGPPFGHELIVAIASSKPLFPAPRPATETTQDYIAALSEALVIANEAGGQPPVASALVITTLPK